MAAPRLRHPARLTWHGPSASIGGLLTLALLVGGPASSPVVALETAPAAGASSAVSAHGVDTSSVASSGAAGRSGSTAARSASAVPPSGSATATTRTAATSPPATTASTASTASTVSTASTAGVSARRSVAAPTSTAAPAQAAGRATAASSGARVTTAAAEAPATSVLPISEPKGASRSALVASSDVNPLAGATLYTDPRTWAGYVGSTTSGVTAAAAARLAAVPQARWVTPSDSASSVDSYVGAATAAGQLPELVLYGIPGRDCGGYSAGGFATSVQYLAWVAGIRQAVAGRPTVVILEPDALASGGCTPLDLPARLLTLAGAVDLLTLDPTTAVYIDAGHQEWLSPQEAATRLLLAHVGKARGFSLNVSNFYATSDEVAYGEQVSALLGGSHFVVDTSRNGAGPAPAAPENWCNPTGRLLGALPSAAPAGATPDGAFDGDLWVKHPGESDGACSRDEPTSGTWYAAWANDIVARSLTAGVFG